VTTPLLIQRLPMGTCNGYVRQNQKRSGLVISRSKRPYLICYHWCQRRLLKADIWTSPISARICSINNLGGACWLRSPRKFFLIVIYGGAMIWVQLWSEMNDVLTPLKPASPVESRSFLTHLADLHQVNLQWTFREKTILAAEIHIVKAVKADVLCYRMWHLKKLL